MSRNPIARAVRRLRPQVVKPRKGKRSYSRKMKRGASVS